MTTQKLTLIFTAVLTISIITIVFSPRKVGYINVNLHYMAYACGECALQYKVTEVLSSDSSLGHLTGQLVDIKFSSKMKTEIKNKAEKCMICFDFIVSGNIYKSYSGVYKLSAKNLELLEREGCCSD